jgi:hypothetical protein
MDLIWGKREAKYFCAKDWTGRNSLMGFDNFAVRRRYVDQRGDFLSIPGAMRSP